MEKSAITSVHEAYMKFRWFLGLFLLVGLGLSQNVYPSDEPQYSFDKVKTSLANIPISQGPDASKLTRSPWGPSLYRNTVDAVVYIMWFPKDAPDTMFTGSGVVVSASGHILTNWHVVRDNAYVLVLFRPKPPKTMADLTDADIWFARNLGTDQQKDIALLQLVTTTNKPKTVDLSFLKFIPLEDPMRVEVGQDVFAIGHPKDLFWSYTEGVISQIRPRYKWRADEDLFQATIVQTQTAIDHGSSGGPLINKEGKLVGLVSSMSTQAGFNFAIAVHELVPLLRP